MKKSTLQHLLRIIGLGALAGMRATSAPFAACYLLSKGTPARGEHKALGLMRSKNAVKISGLMLAGEFIGDKLPTAPDRIIPSAIAGRAVSGAIAGAVLCQLSGDNIAKGAMLGAAAATAGTYGSFYLRKEIVKLSGKPDPIIGAAEDLVLIGLGLLIVRSIKQ